MAKEPDEDFTSMGISALLPGMNYMLTLMRRELETMGRTLDLYNGYAAPAPRRTLGRPKKRTAAETEMAGKHLHPRDPAHPKHEAWVKKLSRSQKAAWRKRHAALPG